ncbi:VOC family protein [Tropicibacter oceani]|uniref:VOC family protein n=1 Tax=Tropicibacter oceani TaxID=3058420 RepID=A0ABY8QDH1_9RHOB|nr:VOC family protein [Tropicibacter oceani]WGW02252.1 VOC family protein [Tropicibacter oceani]
MLELDHIAVLGETLEEAVHVVEDALGLPMMHGGTHERFGTHNMLLGMAPLLYIEAIACDPAAPPPPDPRWFGLDDFKGPARLDKWICRVPDLDAALRALPMAGRRVELSRGVLRWAMAVPQNGQLPFDGMFPALIQWHDDVPPPGKSMTGAPVQLQSLTVRHPDAQALEALLKPHLQAPLVGFETADKAGLAARITVNDEVCLL